MTSFDERFDAEFARIAFTVNRHLIRHMQRMQLELAMDLQTAYIWGILAHLNISGIANPDDEQHDGRLGKGMIAQEIRPVSAHSLAQVAGIPRETVRRKLEILESLGKVARDERRRWYVLQSGVDQKIYEFTKETVRQFLQSADQVKRLLGDTT